jgi:hypothetical protein
MFILPYIENKVNSKSRKFGSALERVDWRNDLKSCPPQMVSGTFRGAGELVWVEVESKPPPFAEGIRREGWATRHVNPDSVANTSYL